MIGKTLSHHKILSKLGAGGMGDVYAANDTELGRQVALKVLPPTMATDPERLERFKREARAVASLNHPNIVTIHSVEEEDGIHFLTMELVEGESLDRSIPDEGLSLKKMFEIAVPLVDALAAAHEKGITHRDLKPANIMVAETGRVKVLDFGLAKLREDGAGLDGSTQLATEAITQEGKILGTVAYMSPEQAEGKTVDPRSDIFSLGIVLYEMATGRRPFSGDTNLSVLSSILRDQPSAVTDLNSALPRHLGRIVRRCLEKDPGRRYQSAIDVRNELEDLQKETSSAESGPIISSVEAGAPSATKRRARWWPVIVGGLVLIAMVGWYQSRDQGDDITASKGEAATQATVPSPTKIVVLPFENLGEAEDEYFAAGMSDEITSRLSSVSGLAVISRNSAQRYAKSELTIPEIGAELDVGYILEGTVRWGKEDQESRVRITPQLIRVADDTQLWSEAYDRVLEDVFALQSDIAGNVIEELGVALLEPERQVVEARPTENLEAYQLYLRGLSHHNSLGERDLKLAIGFFERATALDPEFVEAWSNLAMFNAAMYHMGYDRSPERDAAVEAAIDWAWKIDPDSPATRVAQGFHHYWVHKDYATALAEFALAEARTPNNIAMLEGQAWVLRRLGRWQECLDVIAKMITLDPQNPKQHRELGQTYSALRRFEEAEAVAKRSVTLAPDDTVALSYLAHIYWRWTGDLQRAREVLESYPLTDNPHHVRASYLQEVYGGNYQKALDLLSATEFDRFSNSSTGRPRELLEAWSYSLLGNRGQAQVAWEAAKQRLAKDLQDHPEDFRLRRSLAIVEAGLGNKALAIEAGRSAVEEYGPEQDAFGGYTALADLAWIYTMVGEPEQAIDLLEQVLSVPSRHSAAELRLDPKWDSLRTHLRFKKLVEG